MAGTVHQLWSFGLRRTSQEEDWQPQHKGSYDYPLQWCNNCNNRVVPAYTDFKHKDGELCEKGEKLVHEKARLRNKHKDGELCEKGEKLVHEKARLRN
eukprot:c12532_g1_i1 orf=115-408(+)